MTPLWTILIASVYARTSQLEELLDTLAPQLEPYAGDVTVLIDRDDCDKPIGVKRTGLVEASQSEYVCFIDDDDTVAVAYVAAIMLALRPRPDYVGFRVRYTADGVSQKQTIHSLRYKTWRETDVYERDISHLNPIRRSIALAGLPFIDGFGEDGNWAAKVRASGLLQGESFIDEALYEYRHSSTGSLFGGNGVRQLGYDPGLPAYLFVEVMV